MKMNKERYWAVIFYKFKRDLKRKECFEETNWVLDDK